MCGVVGRWCGRAVERAVGCVEWLGGSAARCVWSGRAVGRQGGRAVGRQGGRAVGVGLGGWVCGVVGRWCGRAEERAVGCVEWLGGGEVGRLSGRLGVWSGWAVVRPGVCGVVGR